MAVENKREVRVATDDGYARRESVVEYNPSTRNVVLNRVSQFLWFVYAIVAVLLMFRIVFRLLDAVGQFVTLVYDITSPMVAPFIGILPQAEAGGFDVPAFVAIIVYAVVIWALTTFLAILFKDSGGFRRVVRQERVRE
ncbi:YggT family protein [Phototrophicus methaneseepsis]|uniref:YggT family protein n=1 Tax=Phototrophicus methaneseepsis TaxID=2710758 RepID=A0A7S8ECS7_9CHLR|nr:YggT family protein [Phototrophicus methaneseepsis]QPC84469.1 YggT family protein [Phototrophicus methaneseepsis]